MKKVILQLGSEVLGATCIEACYAAWSTASERVLQKAGITLVRFIPEGLYKNGAWVPENVMAISNDSWEQVNVTVTPSAKHA